MLEGGADVDKAANNGATPLYKACSGDRGLYEDTLRSSLCVLLKHHADPDRAKRGGLTPLHAAAKRGLADLVRALIAAGASLHPIGGTMLQTPLQLAHTHDSYVCEGVLRDAGASSDVRDTKFDFYLHFADY